MSEKLGTNLAEVGTDCISRQQAIDKFIDGLEEIFADLRERHVDDSVCGLCEYDGAYVGQSGEWCNECPGFDRDDCFKLSDKTRKEWTEEIIKALPPAQPEPNYDEWCTDCKEYDKERHCCPRWNRVIKQTLADAQPEQLQPWQVMAAQAILAPHKLYEDGTLWVTVDDVSKVGRVIVDEEKSKFCRQFYMDAQTEQRTGKWIPQDHNKRAGNISTCVYYYPICSKCGQVGNDTYKYCPHCGAKMEGTKNESD